MNYPAIRAYHKIAAPIFQHMDIAAACDAHYDAGEWSGPAYAELQEIEDSRIICLVATRFNMDRLVLATDINSAMHNENECWYEANIGHCFENFQ